MPTIEDVAKRAGVSISTVSRVTNDNPTVHPALKAIVLDAMKELGYQPNRLARSLRLGRTQTIALLVPDIINPFWTTLSRGVEDKAVENGFSVILCNTDEDPGKEKNYLQVCLQKRVDGIIIASVGRPATDPDHPQMGGIPFVLVDRVVPGLDADIVRSDSLDGARRLTDHLLQLGHRRIGLITGPAAVSTANERVEGYCRALDEFGIPFDPELVLRGNYNDESAYELTKALLSLPDRPTAVFAANGRIAIGTLRALRDAGVQIPKEMAVVAFDEIPQLSAVYPFLTVMTQRAYEMGTIAAQLLLERLAGMKAARREVVLETELIARASSGGANPPFAPVSPSSPT